MNAKIRALDAVKRSFERAARACQRAGEYSLAAKAVELAGETEKKIQGHKANRRKKN